METTTDDPLPTVLLLANFDVTIVVTLGLIILVLLLLSGLVSGSEVAYFSLKPEEIKDCEDSSDDRDKRILYLITHPHRLLATILILNNLINISIVTVSTYLTWVILGSSNPSGWVYGLLIIVTTVVIIFVGEIVPKVYASHNGIGFARLMSGFLRMFYTILKPISWFLMSISNVIERKVERKGYSVSVEELHHALEMTTGDEESSQEEKDILKGIVNFGTLSVKQVMKSRMDISAIEIESDFHELMDQINKNGYSRIPVYTETIDKIEGILYVKDLLPHVELDDDFKWQGLLRPGLFVPESKKIDDLFKDFQEKHVHMAIVVDEYGGTSGLVTMEDIIEEIVGEINDEFDEDSELGYNKIDNNTYIFEGKTSLNDFCKAVDVDASEFEEIKGESESLGGLLLELNSKIPNAGEKIDFDRFVFTIVAVDQKRIKRVRVYITPEEKKVV